MSKGRDGPAAGGERGRAGREGWLARERGAAAAALLSRPPVAAVTGALYRRRRRRRAAAVPAGAEPAVQRPGRLREPAAGARAGQGGEPGRAGPGGAGRGAGPG